MIARRRTICLALLLIGVIALIWVSGVAFWLALGLVAAGLVGVVLPQDQTATFGTSRFAAIALVIGLVSVCLALLEATLWAFERAAAEPLPVFVAAPGAVPLAPELPPEIKTKIERMQDALVMPSSWQKRDLAKIPGTDPFVWHGVLHPIDENGMRRERPFPPWDSERFRIMVVGDSLTYGEGIDGSWTYPAQLERLVAAEARVEVLNLGVRGHASQDILNLVRRFVPELKPDLVVYGVCLNDFLESGAQVPGPPSLLPTKLTKILTRRTRVSRLLDERSGALKRSLGLWHDFYSQILADFDAGRRRFGDDVAAMNAFVTGSSLPPMIAMILDQAPRVEGPGRQLAIAAEQQLQEAGIQIVESEDFYRRYDGQSFRVSRWEGHPNEAAHAIWASQLAEVIRQQPGLARFRKAAATEPKP